MKKIFNNKLTPIQDGFSILATNFLLVLLAFVPVAQAGYQPPEGPPPSGQTAANGTRTNCGSLSKIPLTSLVPKSHVGRTTITKPTLAWFVPVTTPYRISLTIYTLTPGESPKLIKQIERVENTSGINSITLAENDPVLKVGDRYLWEIALACNPDSPRYDQSFVAEFEVTDIPLALADKIAEAKTPVERAEIYAEAGYWYDALREALLVEALKPQLESVSSLLKDLANLEETDAISESSHGAYLKQIANHLNQD